MGMTPVLTVWDGKSYDEILSGDDLHPFLDDILDELEVHHTLPILFNSLNEAIVPPWSNEQHLRLPARRKRPRGALARTVYRNRQRGRLHRRLRHLPRPTDPDLQHDPRRLPQSHLNRGQYEPQLSPRGTAARCHVRLPLLPHARRPGGYVQLLG